jgi:hypothetical protein
MRERKKRSKDSILTMERIYSNNLLKIISTRLVRTIKEEESLYQVTRISRCKVITMAKEDLEMVTH